MSVGHLKAACRAALVGAAVLALLFLWGGAPIGLKFGPRQPPDLLAAAYGALATALGFVAFPFRRRADLTLAGVMFVLPVAICNEIRGAGPQWEACAAFGLGAFCMFGCSCLERFRALARTDPSVPFSLVYPNDRRRRRKLGARLPHAASDAKTPKDQTAARLVRYGFASQVKSRLRTQFSLTRRNTSR